VPIHRVVFSANVPLMTLDQADVMEVNIKNLYSNQTFCQKKNYILDLG